MISYMRHKGKEITVTDFITKERVITMKAIKKAVYIMVIIMMISVLPPENASAATKKTLNVTIKVNGKKTSKKVIAVKQKVQLTVKYGGKVVTSKAKYKTSNKKVISVTKKGKLTPKKAGKCTITVTYKGKSKKIKFTVKAGAPESPSTPQNPSKPHTHVWKPYIGTKKVKVGIKTVCNCGAEFVDLYTMTQEERDKVNEKYHQHLYNHLINGEPSNYSLEPAYNLVGEIGFYRCDCGAEKDVDENPKPPQNHTHAWKPYMVIQKVRVGGKIVCKCGAEFVYLCTMTQDEKDKIREQYRPHMLTDHGGYLVDGVYEDVEFLVSYYCDCGAVNDVDDVRIGK